METRKEIAAEKKRCGSHNCTQAVLCTYHDFTGMDEETIKQFQTLAKKMVEQAEESNDD